MSILDGFDTETLTVTRQSGAFVDGYWQATEPTTVTLSAVIAPFDSVATERAQMFQDETGEHTREPLWLFTTTPVLMADESVGQMADVIARGTRSYKVKRVTPLSTQGETVYEVTAFKVDQVRTPFG